MVRALSSCGPTPYLRVFAERSSLNYFLGPIFGFIRRAYVSRTLIYTHPIFFCYTDSPRLYVSTNPWKMSATFQTISSTREEYLAVIEELKASAPPELKKGEKRSKLEQSHITLIGTLEGRVEAIDAELTVSFLLTFPAAPCVVTTETIPFWHSS
jgi:hypothetical protein